ncbi:MAG TPA: PPC domain-containing protein, partial [Planctomycetaceae bacterium]
MSTCFLLLCVVCAAETAQAAAPQVENVALAVGQRGAEFSLRLVGSGLADAAEIMLYSPSVTSVGMTAESDNEVSFQLRAAADCRLGSHAFRVRTKQGISELRTFRVTGLPVVSETEPNGSLAEAQPVTANVTIAGVVAAGDVDCFQVTLRRGDRLAAEVEAVRLGGALLDTVLTVYGPDGNRLVSVDDTSLFRQDPFVTLVVPEDGRYVVQVRETNYDGDEHSRYALHLGLFPRPAFVYPAGGQVNQALTVRFGGDAAGDFDQEVRLPEAPDGRFGLYAMRHELAAPTPNPFRVSAFGNFLESEPNDSPTKAGSAVAELPVAFNGILDRAGDVDCFRFAASAGASYQFEAFASRLGSPMDSLISIVDATGKVVVSNDDDGTHDSRLIFAAPQAGEYVLCVTDKRGEGGHNFVYRVEASQPEPALLSFLPRPDRKSQDRQAIVVPRGNRVMAMLGTRRMGMEGDVQLVAGGLPSGVSISQALVPADRFAVPVVFESQAEAPLGGGLVELLATGNAGGHAVTGGFVQ